MSTAPLFRNCKPALDIGGKEASLSCTSFIETKKKALFKSTFSSFAFIVEAIIYPAIFSRPMKLKLAIPSIAVLFEGTAVQPPLNSPERTESIPLV